MKTMKLALTLGLMGALGAGVADANLVTNGGFEAGDLSGWTLGGGATSSNTIVSATAAFVHSGTYGAGLGPYQTTGTLSQDLSTDVGQTYQFSFWLTNIDLADSTGPNSFNAFVAGASLMSLLNVTPFGYQQYLYNFTAIGTTTTISFEFRHDPSYWGLDDISVQVVPEPATLALFGLGLGLAAIPFVRRRRTPA